MHYSNFFSCIVHDEDHYDIVIPGSRIPDWFTHKNVGCSVYVELPRDRHDKYVPKGFAVCVVLSLVESGCIISDSNNTSKTTDHTWFAYRPISYVNPTTEFLEFFCDGGTAVKQCEVRLIFEDEVMDNASFLLSPCGRRTPAFPMVATGTEGRRWPPGLREGDESDSEAGHPPFPCFPPVNFQGHMVFDFFH